MPPVLRSRLALIAMLGVFLIPLGTSSLRGLTHVLTCQDETETPFTIIIDEGGEAILLSSISLQRGGSQGLCGGLFLNMRASSEETGRVQMTLPIQNRTSFPWKGTVKLVFDKVFIPVNIGEIAAGATAVDTVSIRVDPGTHELNGSLLIGP